MKTTRHAAACMLILALAFVFTACGPAPAPSASAAPTLTPAQTAAGTPSATPTPAEPTLDPALVSPTTGLQYSGQYRPVAVIYNNHKDCWPQTGLSSADVVYEFTVEGGVTRFMAVFNDHLPEKAGSVRSSRVSSCDLWQEWQCIYCHWGGEGDMSGPNSVAQTFKTTGIQIRVDGLVDTTYMFRDASNHPPHNGFVNVAKAAELYEKKNYTPPVHTFAFDPQAALSAWQPISTLSIPYGYPVNYQWDAASGSFLRFSNKKPTVDKDTGSQIGVKNLIVMFMPHRTLPTAEHHVVIDNVGSGKAIFCRDGKYIEGTWEKQTKQSPAVYKDKNGDPVTFTPGNTWISVVKTGFGVAVE